MRMAIEDPCVGVELIQQLYRSWKVYAEKLTSEQLGLLHVPTEIDENVASALRSGMDVVLTGNPGDGKTHLMMLVREKHADLGQVEWIRDATAVEADGSTTTAEETIYRQWVERRSKGIVTCLAINQGVLREMLRVAPKEPFTDEVERQLREQLYYLPGVEPTPAAQNVLVLDLDRRSPLKPEFVRAVLSNLIDEKFYPECTTCPHRVACSVPRNRQLLASEQVQERIAGVLNTVGQSGLHATVRDVQGMLAFAITGGKGCADLMRTTHVYGTRFYDLLYEGEGLLFDAVRSTFDPGRISDPLVDDALWTGTYGGDGWDEASDHAAPPNSARDDREALRRFISLKRAFYFNQIEGARLESFLPSADRDYYELLETAEMRKGESARRIIRLINGFFSRSPTDRELRIWGRHHFDVPPSRVYFSTKSLRAKGIIVALPRLAGWQQLAGGYQVDHMLVHAVEDDRVIGRLRIDRDVYRGLVDASEGQPFALRRPELTKALETFLAQLGANLPGEDDVVEVAVESFKSGRSYQFEVYTLDRRYGA